MLKLGLLLVLLVVGVLGQDFRLLNSTEDGSAPGSAPIWARTSLGTQPPPRPRRELSGLDITMDGDGNQAPVLYWGNSFVVRNIRPQNDTFSASRKRLNPSFHFSIENQTIAMEGQEYLIRPRAYINTATLDKRARTEELPLNGEFVPPGRLGYALEPFTITPKWAAFRLTNSSNPSSQTVAFYDSETIQSAGASFNFWASNPSATYWFSPGAYGFNISDPALAEVNVAASFSFVTIEWLAACRWIANGTDCGDDGMGDGEICSLVEDGLCWARFEPPRDVFIEQINPNGTVSYNFTQATQTFGALEDWAIATNSRPLFLTALDGVWSTSILTSLLNSSPSPVTMDNLKIGKDTPYLTVGLPLNRESLPADQSGQIVAGPGTSLNEWLRRFMPGKDNAGGTLEITVHTVIEVPDTVNFPNQVSRAVSHIQMVPPKVVISRESPTASFYFANITKPLGVKEYVVYFLVTETSPSTITIANTSASFGEFSGTYPNGAYAIPNVVLTPEPYSIGLRNFPFGGSGVNQMPIMPEALFNCSAAGNAFVAQLTASPASIGQSSISLPFNITPDGSIKFWTCSESGGKRQATPTQISSFQFIGSTTTVVFYVTTQSSPVDGITLSFGTPVLSNAALIDPITGFNFAQNGTYLFAVTQNDVHVDITNNAGQSLDQTGGPFVNQDFYMQFQWTPATLNGFSIAVTGLYTSYPSSAVLSNSGLTATLSVPAGSSGYLAGPFRASSPSNVPQTDPTFQILYSVSIVPSVSGPSDASWYRLLNALEPVTISRHRFALINGVDGPVELLITGVKSQPLCIGAAFPGAVAPGEEVWVSMVPETDSEFLIVEPVIPATGVLPPNALRLTSATPSACFTVRFDTNWQFVNDESNDRAFDNLALINGTLSMLLSGPNATAFNQQTFLANLPIFVVVKPKMQWTLGPSAFDLEAGQYAVGESVLLWVTMTVPPPHGLSYNLSFSGATIVPISAGAGRFANSSALQHLWQLTFDALPVADATLGHSGITPVDRWRSVLTLVPYGEDAVFFVAPEPATLDCVPRLIQFESFTEPEDGIGISLPFEVEVGHSAEVARVALLHPVLSELTLVPRSRNAGDAGITFSPESFTFTPESVNSVEFTVTGELLGTWEFTFVLTGDDSVIFRWDSDLAPTQDFSVSVTRRAAPTLVNLPTSPVSPFVAGQPSPPLSLRFDSPVLPGEDVTVTLDTGSDFELSQSVFVGANGSYQYFDATYLPASPFIVESSLRWTMKLSGADAWKYNVIEYFVRVSLRQFAVTLPTELVPGVRYAGSVSLENGPSPTGCQILLTATDTRFFAPGSTAASASVYPITFSPQERIRHFEFITTTPVTVAYDSTPAHLFVAVADSGFDGNRLFSPASIETTVTVKPRKLSLALPDLELGSLAHSGSIAMVNRESIVYTVVATAPPENGVTLTLTHPKLRWNGGQSSAVLQFGPGQLTATFSFVATGIPDNTFYLSNINAVLSGPDAALYIIDFYSVLSQIRVFPELGFTPIPPIYVDGEATGLKVWLIDALAQGFSYGANAAFTLRIEAPPDVLVEPSRLQFSSSALSNNRLSQEFSIRHVRPSRFANEQSYSLKWHVMFGAGILELDIPVPADARQVLLLRHQIMPSFPERLSFGWQQASFNLSRAPMAHMSLVPHAPVSDGNVPAAAYASAYTAGGRLIFEPPTIVFSPGQQVAHFQVKALPGNDQKAVYYRVQWEIVGQQDDLVNYLEWQYPQADRDVRSHFATWHTASSAQLACRIFISLAVVSILFMILAL